MKALPVVLVLLAATPSLAADFPDTPLDADPFSSPYVYQNVGRGREMSVTLQYEAGYGTRESRNFAQKGIEQGLRVRFQPYDFLGVEAFGGVVIGAKDGASHSEAASFEVIGRALNQRQHYINLDLGAGYLYDYRSNHVPRVRLTIGRSFGDLDVSLSGLMEFPVHVAGRDSFDVMTSLAVSYGFLPWFRFGMEVAGEDLEGLFETEAEGGAKVLFGPTFAFTMPYDLFFKLNAAAVRVFNGNQASSPGAALPAAWGLMARGAVGWTWH